METQSQKPELLSPAGDEECLRAAVENGADAVYFGLEDGFNARARAQNFQLSGLPDLMVWLHRRGVKGYVTLNTLAFSDELPRIEQILRHLAAARVDAVLVQDLGVARLAGTLVPELGLHASTQMTLTSAECLQAVAGLGIRRVVLPRELSIAEIRQIREQSSVELEVFVHGALCVAYSGQCLTSESMGGRSANRGQCAQACRLPYEIVCDNELRDFGDQKYLLSPQDLAAWPLTADLIEAGVSCFKIEGRLKTPEYVANTTRHYREAIDSAFSGKTVAFSRRRIQELEQSFSRGLSPGWLRGCDHKMLVPATSSAKRGVFLGTVRRVDADRVGVLLEYSITAGDGIVFEGDRFHGEEQGGRVFEVLQERTAVRLDSADEGAFVDLTFARNGLDFSRLNVGQRIWKTDDPRLNKRLRRTFESADPQRKIDLTLNVTAVAGSPLLIEGTTRTGCTCRVLSGMPLEVARRHPLTREVLVEQLSRLGGTVYRLESLQETIVGGPMVPLSVLGQMRREMVEQLDASLPGPGPIVRESVLEQLRPRAEVEEKTQSVRLCLLCRTPAQLRQAVETDADELIADFQDPRDYREAVALARAIRRRLYLATPRIQKPGETGIFRAMAKLQPDAVLVRNPGGLMCFREAGVPFATDYSLNVTNELTAAILMESGSEWITPSYDLNRDQLTRLVSAVPPAWLEIVIHQHMPMFHMEHCVFCAMLSPGTNKSNCGRPCDIHQVELRDRTGTDHPLIADIGCRNTLFNAVPQSSAEIVPDLLAQGVRRFRVELLRDQAGSEARLVQTYCRLLNGEVSGGQVWRDLHAMNRVGVTRGTLEPARNPLAIL